MIAHAAMLACLVGCTKAPPAPAREVSGTLSIGGEPIAVTACEVEPWLDAIVIELRTPQGRLRIEEKAIYFNPDPSSVLHGDELSCDANRRNLGTGTRTDRTAYASGTLAFTCKHGGRVIAGDLTLECGHMTDDERKAIERSTADVKKLQHDMKPTEIRKALESMAEDASVPDASP